MIIVDIETSGLDPKINGMLSLGAVDLKTNQEFYIECQLTDGREANEKALEINGFTQDQIKDSNKLTDVEALITFCRWTERLEDKMLGGHNIGHLDILFLEEIWSRVDSGCFGGLKPKFPFSYRTVDSATLGYALFKKSLSLKDLCLELGVEPENKTHNALEGARKCKEIMKIMLDFIKL
jgi:DNA polymerase III alpha subunit (gram-positive type)